MAIISELITPSTNIIYLNQATLTDKEKCEMLGLNDLDSYLKSVYILNLCEHEGLYYYFKLDRNNLDYRLSLLDELVASYIASLIGLKGLDYSIAYSPSDDLGIASTIFRKPGIKYHYFKALDFYTWIESNFSSGKIEEYSSDIPLPITYFLTFCETKENKDELKKELYKKICLDILTAQNDAVNINIQFEENERGFHLSNVYDYSNCKTILTDLSNVLIGLGNYKISSKLRDKYPKYMEYLTYKGITEKDLKRLILADPTFKEILLEVMEINLEEIYRMVAEKHQLLVSDEILRIYRKKSESIQKKLVNIL